MSNSRYHPLSYLGMGIFLAIFLLMAGTLNPLGWWEVNPPLRYAVLIIMILGIVLYVLGQFLTWRRARNQGEVDKQHTERISSPEGTSYPGNEMRNLCIVACVLLAFGIAVRLVALHFRRGSHRAYAEGWAVYEPYESDDPRSFGFPGPEDPYFAEAERLAHVSNTAAEASFVAALAGAVLFIYSFAHGFRKLTVIPVVLLLINEVFFIVALMSHPPN